MGETSSYIEENGRMLLFKKMNGFNITAMQTIVISEYGKPNKIKYKEACKRVLVYDGRNVHLEFDDTIGY